MQICHCQFPRPKPAPNAPGQKLCEVCQQWWLPQHGSRQPALTTITAADWKRELTIARATPNGVVQFMDAKSREVLAQAKSFRLLFGKHEGKKLEEIAAEDILYLDWLNGQEWTRQDLKAAVAVLCKYYEREIDRAMEGRR